MRQEEASMEMWGIYISAAAAVGVWLLKSIGDHASKKRKIRATPQVAITRNLWNFLPEEVSRSNVSILAAWWRLVCVGLLVCGIVPAMTSSLLGSDNSLLLAAGLFLTWFLFLVYYALRHILLGKDVDEKQRGKLPVTIVTGFLGCGKTTLINHILNNDRGKKILVIENEIGEEGIDNELLLKDQKEEIVLMKNGCICCSVRGDLIRVFHGLMDRPSFSSLDWVIIETTGLADPAPVAQTMYMDDRCRKALEVDAVVAVVDCKHLPRRLAEGSVAHKGGGGEAEAAQQLAFADRVLLNKTDLVSGGELEAVRGMVAELAPQAEVMESEFSRVDVGRVVGVRAFGEERLGQVLSAAEGGAAGRAWATGRRFGGVATFMLRCEGELDLDTFNQWVVGVLQGKGIDIFRFKGILAMRGYEEKFVVQGMHMLFDGRRGQLWPPGEERGCRLVFIGRNIKKEDFEEGFLACRAQEGGGGKSS